jgi:hypothetical protein
VNLTLAQIVESADDRQDRPGSFDVGPGFGGVAAKDTCGCNVMQQKFA